ncbi:MAG TPA: MFS transporter [bacterium]|nr:MFS transporter [bacterium]
MRVALPSRRATSAAGVTERLRPRGVVLRVAVVIGLAELGFATVIPLLPLHLTERLGASVKMVGFVVAAFALTETILKTAWGSVADRLGRRPMIITGLVVSSIAPLLMSVLRQAWLFIPLRVIDGAGSSALWPAASAIIADTTPPHRRATAMGVLNMFFLAGLAFGPTLGLFVVGFSGSYTAGFYLAAIVLLVAAVVAAFTLRGLGHTHLPPSDIDVVGYHGTAPNPELEAVVEETRRAPLLGVMLVVAFVQMFGAGLLAPILVIYAKRIVGLSEQLIGTLFLVLMLAVALASLVSGHLADRWGKMRLVSLGMVLGSLGLWLLPLSPRLSLLAVSAVLLGVSYALSTPAWHALISELAPPGRIGLALGASQTAQGLGLVLGPLLGGLMWDTLGHQSPFLGAAALFTVGTVVLLVAMRRLARGGRPSGRR